MSKISVLRYAAIGMATLSLAGFAAASTVDFDTTGPDSNNQVKIKNTNVEKNKNINILGVANFNVQASSTGDVKAYKNTSVDGDLESGDASNSNETDTNVSVSNSSGGGAGGSFFGGDDSVSFDTTGPDSNNQVKISNKQYVSTTNVNVVEVLNENIQAASSGDVKAYKNTTVGGLSSGDASNENSTSTTVDISND